MNIASTIRITIENRDHGKTVRREVFSFVNPPYDTRALWIRRGGIRSKKFEQITITEFVKLFGGMFREWLK